MGFGVLGSPGSFLGSHVFWGLFWAEFWGPWVLFWWVLGSWGHFAISFEALRGSKTPIPCGFGGCGIMP